MRKTKTFFHSLKKKDFLPPECLYVLFKRWTGNNYVLKGPYPLGDFGKIGAIIDAIIDGRRPIIAPATP